MLTDFMRLCLIQKHIPVSWGISNIQISDNYIGFDVFASKYQGRVTINGTASSMSIRIDATEKIFADPSEALEWLDSRIE